MPVGGYAPRDHRQRRQRRPVHGHQHFRDGRVQAAAHGQRRHGAGSARLSPFSGCTLYAPGQEIWLQNRTSGQAPLIVETDSNVTVTYGFNNLSDSKVKANIRDADTEWLQAVFDKAEPKNTIAQTSTTRTAWDFWRMTSWMPLSPARLTGKGGAHDLGLFQAHGRAVGRGQAASKRVEKLEKKPKPKASQGSIALT